MISLVRLHLPSRGCLQQCCTLDSVGGMKATIGWETILSNLMWPFDVHKEARKWKKKPLWKPLVGARHVAAAMRCILRKRVGWTHIRLILIGTRGTKKSGRLLFAEQNLGGNSLNCYHPIKATSWDKQSFNLCGINNTSLLIHSYSISYSNASKIRCFTRFSVAAI